MTSIFDENEFPTPKVLSVGESGVGKSGAEVALVCAGWKLRKIDTDAGISILRGLLTSPHYPYGEICRRRGIDLATAIDFQVVDTKIVFDTVQHKIGNRKVMVKISKPKDANAWAKVHDLLENWPGAGHLEEWDRDTVLSIDSGTSLGELAYWYSQYLSNRLGDWGGYDYQRDVGVAQDQVRRILRAITHKDVKCRVNFITHIRRVDTQAGYARSPSEIARQNAENNTSVRIDPRGYPSIIGVALSPQVGIRFNDMFVYKRDGGGLSTRRYISTLPVDNIDVKSSTWLQPEYPITSGLYEIFETLAGREPDPDLVREMRGGSTGGPGSPAPTGLNLPPQ